jgi:hypothetical protein
MSVVDQKIARKRLEWVDLARGGIIRACDDVVGKTFHVFPTVDPLRFILKIPLNFPIGKDTRAPLRAYLRCWAEDHGCDVPVIRINDYYIQAEILTRARVWHRDQKGRFSPQKRFERKVK